MSSPALQDVVAVLGCPAAGNPVQYLCERAADDAGLDVRFFTAEVQPAELAAALAGAAAMGFRGCLLAGPLEAAALPFLTSVSPAATFAGAVNLVHRQADEFFGHFTTGRGVVAALRSHVDPAGVRALVVGAGPGGRAVALELALAGAAGVVICDRDSVRAEALAEALRSAAVTAPVELLDHGAAVEVPADIGIVVVAVEEDEPPLFTSLRADHVIADLTVGTVPSPVARQAAGGGACLVDGQEIHAARIAIDFHTLTGVATDPDVLRDALDEFLSA
jgi:shikimate dehydrogenase